MRINSSCLKGLRDSDVAIMGGRVLVLSPSCPHRNIPHGATCSPVSLTGFAEITRLVDIVVVVVTEFSVHAFAAGAW